MSKYQQCLSTKDTSPFPMQLCWSFSSLETETCSRDLSELLRSLLVPSQKQTLRFFLAAGEAACAGAGGGPLQCSGLGSCTGKNLFTLPRVHLVGLRSPLYAFPVGARTCPCGRGAGILQHAVHFCEPTFGEVGAQTLTFWHSFPTAGQKTRYGHKEFWCDVADACTKRLGLTT